MICHFILTRFNLRIFKNDKNGNEVMTPEWLKNRFQLFEQYTLSSIVNQSVKNFKWICLFDKDTPEVYLGSIEGYEQMFPGFMPYFLNADEAFHYQK